MATQQFDYRGQHDDILSEVESLSTRQCKLLSDALKAIKDKTEHETTGMCCKWVYDVILPVLKGYAEETESLLTVQQDGNIIIATLKNPAGFEFPHNWKRMKSMFMFSDHISIEISGNIPSLSLTFDCCTFI